MNEIKIDNSIKNAITKGNWRDPGAKLYDDILLNTNWKDLLKEAYLVAPVNDITNELRVRTRLNGSGCKYPHHLIKDGKLVVSISGLRSAYICARNQGCFNTDSNNRPEYSRSLVTHLNKHFKELGIKPIWHHGELYFQDIKTKKFVESNDINEFNEKSHGDLKYVYRIGVDINTGRQVAVQFIMDPSKITSVGNKDGYEVSHLLKNPKSIDSYIKIEDEIKRLNSNGQFDKATEWKSKLDQRMDVLTKNARNNALEFVKKNIKKTGHIDHITDDLIVDKIFYRNGNSINSVKLVPILSNDVKLFISYLEKKYDLDSFKVKNPSSYGKDGFSYSFKGLFGNRKINEEFVEYFKDSNIPTETYKVGTSGGKNKYKTTKLTWDTLYDFMKFTKSPSVRGYLTPYTIKNNNAEYNGYNKPKYSWKENMESNFNSIYSYIMERSGINLFDTYLEHEPGLTGPNDSELSSEIDDIVGRTPEAIYEWMHSNISYDKTIQGWTLKTPAEVFKSRTGNCHDQSLFESFVFHSLGIINGQLFFVEFSKDNPIGGNTHTLTWYRIDTPNEDFKYSYYWFENAWEDQAGIHGPYNDIDGLKHAVLEIYKKDNDINSHKYDGIVFSTLSNYRCGMSLGEYVESWRLQDDHLINESSDDIKTVISESVKWIENFANSDKFQKKAMMEASNAWRHEFIAEWTNPADRLFHNMQGISIPMQLFKFMNKIKYGWISGDDGQIHGTGEAEDENYFFKHYRLQSPDELASSLVGVCWDQTEFERYWFNKHGYGHKVYYLELNDGEGCPSHTFVSYISKNTGRLYWFEHSWNKHAGIHFHKTETELLKDVVAKHQEAMDDYTSPIILRELKDTPRYGMTCEEFMNFAHNQPEININETMTESTSFEEFPESIFTEKSHGLLKYCYRIGFDVDTGKEVAVQFILDSSKITKAGDDINIDFARQSTGNMNKSTDDLNSDGIDKLKRNIKKYGYIDFTTDELKVDKIFYKNGGSVNSIKLIPLFSRVVVDTMNSVDRFFLQMKNLDLTSNELFATNEFQNALMSKIKSSGVGTESYIVGSMSGKGKYKTTKLLWDREALLSYKFTPVLRGFNKHGRGVNISDMNDYIDKDLNNKFKESYEGDIDIINSMVSVNAFFGESWLEVNTPFKHPLNPYGYPIDSDIEDIYIESILSPILLSELADGISSEVSSEYDPPLPYDQLPDHLKNDPVHAWRAKHGIELIHKEPTLEELNRIWKNWQLMSDEQKIISDNESIRFFGMNNEDHYYALLKEYDNLNESYSLTNIPDKLYFASPIELKDSIHVTTDRGLFLTPYIGIASLFVIDRKSVMRQYFKNALNLNGSVNISSNYTIGYDEWDLPDDKLNSPLDMCHIKHNIPNIQKVVNGTSTGYIHEIDVTYVKDQLQLYLTKDANRELIYKGSIPLKITKVISHTINWEIRYDNEYHKKAEWDGTVSVKEYNPVLSEETNIPNTEFLSEKISDGGFCTRCGIGLGDEAAVDVPKKDYKEIAAQFPSWDGRYGKLGMIVCPKCGERNYIITESGESMPKQTDAAESNKNGVNRKKLYIAFIEWCKEYNNKNTFGSLFDKDVFNVTYPFVPEEMRYFYRLANPLLCVLSGQLTFFQVSELKKLNSENSKLNEMMIFAATPNDMRVFHKKDKKVYKGIDENGQLKLAEVLGNTFDTYIQGMIKKGDILNSPNDEVTEN